MYYKSLVHFNRLNLSSKEENKVFRKKKEIFHVGKVEIIINESTLDVFRNTIYYVDVQDALCIKGVPFITCDIYEDEFSDHLIAQVGLEDDEENDILPSIEELKNKKIVCFIQLDEHIMRQNYKKGEYKIGK